MKRALIIGGAGQDGSYLTEQLVARGLAVVGLDLAGVTVQPAGSLTVPPAAALTRPEEVDALVAAARPDHLFYLAAFHHSSEQAPNTGLEEVFQKSFQVHVDAWVSVLEALGRHAPSCRAFYAASSHVFGTPAEPTQSEQTPFAPASPYAISKAAGVEVARFYRQKGRHASVGILYNHESPRRPHHFVSQRIALGAAGAAKAPSGAAPRLELGNLSAVVDWGYAPDYTEAMWRITEHPEPGDYVVATGAPHTVSDFCAAAYGAVGLDWRPHVSERGEVIARRVSPLVGDASKLRRLTGWAPSVSFEQMVRLLVAAAR